VEQRLIHEIPLGTIGQVETPSLDTLELALHALHADRGCEAAEEEPAGLQNAPGSQQHGFEVRVVAGEMEDSAADDHVGTGNVERHMFDGFEAKIRRWKRGREHAGEGADAIDGLRVGVRGENFVTFPQEIDKVSTGAASGVQDSHSGRDTAFQKLVEKIDVDRAKLFLEGGHGRCQT